MDNKEKDKYTLELADGLVGGMSHLINIPSGDGIRLQLVLHIQAGILEALDHFFEQEQII